MHAAFQNLIQSFLERPLAAAFGIFGFLCLLIWPLFRARRAMLTAQFGIGIGYCLHYLLIGAWTGAGITALGASQTAFSIWVAGHPRLRVALLGFLPLVAGVTWATWGGLPSLFAGTALTLIMLGRLQRDEIRMRVFLLAASPFGMTYDLLIGSLPALAGGTAAMTLGIVMLVREICRRAKERRRAGRPAALVTWFRSWPRFVGALGLRAPLGTATR
jgi:hypothetical protein